MNYEKKKKIFLSLLACMILSATYLVNIFNGEVFRQSFRFNPIRNNKRFVMVEKFFHNFR